MAGLEAMGRATGFPLDACIAAIRQTGADMSGKYKETALGGLAVKAPNC